MECREYKGYSLSDFQEEAIIGIENNINVILSTHTGNGKTLVADYAIDLCHKNGWKSVYTAPIKALSNQKYNQFIEEYGVESVGLITGDTVINQGADILVVTTEILRNMMQESREHVSDIRFIILDEIHYISNEERGTVWEEVIIFKGKNTKIIGLSATIPNIEELCDWISSIHDEEVKMVFYPDRIVKQRHFYFDKRLGKASYNDIITHFKKELETKGGITYKNTHMDFVKYARKNDMLPILYFTFSRRQCETKALEASRELDLLDGNERLEVQEILHAFEYTYPQIKASNTWDSIKETTLKGFGFHHAGLIPIIKQFMEMMFETRLCKVLYATETFAVGINYPVRTVGFDSVRKFDGKVFRNLLGHEYLQTSGRAGRRGIDNFGYVFVLADYTALEKGDLYNIENVTAEPIRSRFYLSYNTALNLTNRHSMEEIAEFFKKSFANYQYISNLDRYVDNLKSIENKAINTKTVFTLVEGCNVKDADRCPIIFEKNNEKFKLLNMIINDRGSTKEEREAASREAKELNDRLSKKCAKCNKRVKKECEKEFRKCINAEKDIKKNERSIKKQIENKPEVIFLRDYDMKMSMLKEFGYVDNEKNLLPRGRICSKLHVQELLVTELLFKGFFLDEKEDFINAVAAGIVFENPEYKNSALEMEYDFSSIVEIVKEITRREIKWGLMQSTNFFNEIAPVMFHFSRGEDLFELTRQSGIPEGDFVAICRRTIDLLRQVKNAMSEDKQLIAKMNRCIEKLNRDVVALGL